MALSKILGKKIHFESVSRPMQSHTVTLITLYLAFKRKGIRLRVLKGGNFLGQIVHVLGSLAFLMAFLSVKITILVFNDI